MQSGSKAASSEVRAIADGRTARRRNQWCSEVPITSDVGPASWWQLVLAKGCARLASCNTLEATHPRQKQDVAPLFINAAARLSGVVAPGIRQRQAATVRRRLRRRAALAATAYHCSPTPQRA